MSRRERPSPPPRPRRAAVAAAAEAEVCSEQGNDDQLVICLAYNYILKITKLSYEINGK